MTRPGEGRFEEVARKARRVQDAIECVRGRAAVGDVRIEVAADGRITALELPDAGIAQAVSRAHERALACARDQAADLRRDLTDDPIVTNALRHFVQSTAPSPHTARPPANATVPQESSPPPDPEPPNPYALPAVVRHRYGLT